MSNRVKSKRKRFEQMRNKVRCPKCKSTNIKTTRYPAEGRKLHICAECSYPWRVKLRG